jgi:hypothetical protein
MGNFFPRWTNWLPLKIAIALVFIVVGVAAGVTYYFTPKYTRVGYMPTQPVPFSHKIHAGQLGLDCRFCHTFGERGSHSNIPNNQTCANCHGEGKGQIKISSPKLEPVRNAAKPGGEPIQWVKVHKAPDYVYFNHSAHLNRGISCVSCHGRVDQMDVVWHHEPQSMGWCLECHREPENKLRPLSEVTNLAYEPKSVNREAFYKDLLTKAKADEIAQVIKPEANATDLAGLMKLAEDRFGKEVTQAEVGPQIKKHWQVAPPENCTACHR